MTVTYGWDASDYDWPRGPMDLAAAYHDGIRFFTHKATEGTTVTHRHYGAALARARDAGVPVLGAYHVVRTAHTVAEQLAHFLAYVNAQTPWWSSWPHWMWQVDCERWPYDDVSAQRGHDFATALAAHTGKRTVLYASKGEYSERIPAGTALWNAHYGANPTGHYTQHYPGDASEGWGRYSGVVPTFLQYGSKLTIGRQPGCDANAFRGDLNALLNWVAPAAPRPPAPHPHPAPAPHPAGPQPGSRELEYRAGHHMTGPDVHWLQQHLGVMHAGAADGDFGLHTRMGVYWFQRTHRLKPDGIVGQHTWAKMGVRWTG